MSMANNVEVESLLPESIRVCMIVYTVLPSTGASWDATFAHSCADQNVALTAQLTKQSCGKQFLAGTFFMLFAMQAGLPLR